MPVPNFLNELWTEAANLSNETQRAELAVATDGDLSTEGKEKRLASLRSSAADKRADLKKRYLEDNESLAGEYQRIIEGPKPATLRERIEKAFQADSIIDQNAIGDNGRVLALIESNDAVIRATERASFVSLASWLDAEGFSALMQRLADAGDYARLDALREIANIRGDTNSIRAIDAVTRRTREENYDLKQRRAAKYIELLHLDKELFLYGMQVSERGELFSDLRGGDSYKRITAEIEAMEAKSKG